MKCAHGTDTENPCAAEAAQIVAFPWADPVPLCGEHVALARQLMTNLQRENELRVDPISEQELATGARLELGIPTAPPAPPAAPALQAAAESGELELVKAKLELATKQLELVAKVDRWFDALLTRVETAIKNAVDLETSSTVDGATEPEPLTVPAEPDQPSPDSPPLEA